MTFKKIGLATIIGLLLIIIPGAYDAIQEWRHTETVELNIIRKEKARVETDLASKIIFHTDFYPDRFYAQDGSGTWYRMSVETFNRLPRGKVEAKITIRNKEPYILRIMSETKYYGP